MVSPLTSDPTKIDERKFADVVNLNIDNLTEVAHAQRNDPKIAPFIQYHENGELPSDAKLAHKVAVEHELYALEDGVLFRTVPTHLMKQ